MGGRRRRGVRIVRDEVEEEGGEEDVMEDGVIRDGVERGGEGVLGWWRVDKGRRVLLRREEGDAG